MLDQPSRVTSFMATKYPKSKKLTVVQQAVSLRQLYPESECSTHRNHLSWTGILQPTAISREYTVSIDYAFGKSAPHTHVAQPTLLVPAGKHLPHVYSQKEQRLCLYSPFGNPEWNPSMCIARTIVPWASEWLFYYELWLATGKWFGGGIHLNAKKDQR